MSKRAMSYRSRSTGHPAEGRGPPVGRSGAGAPADSAASTRTRSLDQLCPSTRPLPPRVAALPVSSGQSTVGQMPRPAVQNGGPRRSSLVATRWAEKEKKLHAAPTLDPSPDSVACRERTVRDARGPDRTALAPLPLLPPLGAMPRRQCPRARSQGQSFLRTARRPLVLKPQWTPACPRPGLEIRL